MRNVNIKNNTDFNKNTILVAEVIKKTTDENAYRFKGDIIIEDYDCDRVYIKYDNNEYIIRTWNIYNTKNGYAVEWTFFKIVDDIDEMGRKYSHGIELSSGVSKIKVK